MATATLDLIPSNIGSPFAVVVRQPDASALRATVIVRARVQSRIGIVLVDTLLELGRGTVEAPASMNGAGDRVVAVGAVPGAIAFEAECSVADLEGIEIQTGPYLALVEPLTWIAGVVAADPGGLESVTEVETSPAAGGAVVVGVEQADTSVNVARVIVEAFFGNAWTEIGRRTLAAPGPSGPGRRIVALGAIPGARRYRVRAKSADAARPFVQVGPYQNLSTPFSWLAGGVPVPPPGAQQPETITYCAPNGNDATGQRGSYDRPFRSLAAALAVVQSGDAIHLAPGVYDPVAPADFPAALAAVSIVGQGEAGTVRIVSPVGVAFDVTPGPAPQQINLSSLTIESQNPGSAALSVVAPALGTGNNSTLRAQGCRFVAAFGAAVLAENLAAVELEGCGSQGAIRVVNCNGGLAAGHRGGDLTIRIDDPVPAHVTRGIFAVRGGAVGILGLEGEAWIDADRDVYAGAVNGGTAPPPAGPTAALRFHGEAALVDLAPSGTGAGLFDLQQARIDQLQINSGVAAPNVQAVNAGGAQINRAALVSGGGGDLVLDTRGGSLGLAGSSFGAACYWDRAGGAVNAAPLAPGAVALAFGGALPGFPFPPGTPVAYLVTPIVVAPPALGTDQLVVTSQDHTGCTINNGWAVPVSGNVSWARVN